MRCVPLRRPLPLSGGPRQQLLERGLPHVLARIWAGPVRSCQARSDLACGNFFSESLFFLADLLIYGRNKFKTK
jgi:hypothetical protein